MGEGKSNFDDHNINDSIRLAVKLNTDLDFALWRDLALSGDDIELAGRSG